ncbi:G-patch domain-containing protein [Pilobolus umbonatus]|nr:G-patch domain-containing protein [Pilobolus umbonatus]
MLNNQQKPAFKFVIRSKIEEETNDDKGIVSTTKTDDTNKTAVSLINDRKRKRTDKETPSVKKKIHSQLERWNQKKKELKSMDDTEEESDTVDYSDYTSLACLLCQRKFKTTTDLTKHASLSALHKTNLKDTAAVYRASNKIRTLKKDAEKAEQTTEYRNRAAERRQAYGQPENPVLSPPSPPRHKIIKDNRPVVPQASIHTPISDDNVGARMLAQMGWRKGEGLGKDGTGIVNPVKAESYTKSAGIGASSRRDVGLDESYNSRTLDLARKRFENGV